MSKAHTPGPWRVEPITTYQGFYALEVTRAAIAKAESR